VGGDPVSLGQVVTRPERIERGDRRGWRTDRVAIAALMLRLPLAKFKIKGKVRRYRRSNPDARPGEILA